MEVNLLTPFLQVPRRSVAVAAGVKHYTGRWASLNSAGEAVLPTAAGPGYLVLEGTHEALAVDGSKVVTSEVALPSAVAANQVALAYGVFRAEIDTHGFILGTIAVGDGLELDASGRLIKLAAGVRVATCEAVSASKLVIRTLAVA